MKLTYRKYYPPEFEVRKPRVKVRNKLGGMNDAGYATQPRVKGAVIWCPAYRKWWDILKRVYCRSSNLKCPTYIDVEVCQEWVDSFMVFRKWFFRELSKTNLGPRETQVDKDILTDLKLYSPETCILVSSRINSLLLNCRSARGHLPQGVSKYRSGYQGMVRTPDGRKRKTFPTIKQASDWYREEKIKVINSIEIPYWLDEQLIRNRLLEIFQRQIDSE